MLKIILTTGITILIIGAAILTLFFAMWGGINYIMSQGDKEKIKSAQEKIKYAIIGLIITLLSFFIINLFSTFFKVDLLNAF